MADPKKSEDQTDQKEEIKEEPVEIKVNPGSYRIHVFVENGRALMPPEGRSTSDPVVTVKVFDQHKSTKALDDVGNASIVYWGEHIYFEVPNMTPEHFHDSKITIEVRDHCSLWKDALMGVYELDMMYVYSQPKHAIFHRWIVLSNPEAEDFEVLRGYLKLGISVLHSEDKPVDLAIKEKLSEKDKDLMLPPHVKPKVMQLHVEILKADGLPLMDKSGTLDAYCVAKFAGAEVKTSTLTADEATMSVYWKNKLFIPVLQPCVTNYLTLTVWDHDYMSKDDLVGSVVFHLEKIKQGVYSEYFWANLYGAPPLLDNDAAMVMNYEPKTASTWRGRILLRMWCDNPKETYKKCENIEDPSIDETIQMKFEDMIQFELRGQVFSGTALHEKDGKYSVEVRWGDTSLESSVKKASNGEVSWYETLQRKIVYIPASSMNALPDIFVYLVYDEKRICYKRIKASGQRDPNIPSEWYSLVPDKAVGEIKEDWKAGFLRARVYVGQFDMDNDDQSQGGWNKRIAEPPMQDWFLLCHIFQARDLPASDKTGLSDPYLRIYCSGSEINTRDSPKEQTLNPRWYATYPLRIRVPDVNNNSPVVIYLMDYDAITSDEMMGRCLVDLSDAVVESESAPRPMWYEVSLGTKESVQGGLLASFSLFKNQNFPRFNIMPKFVDKTVEISVLGLRDLTPAVGWLPVNKAFVRFDLNSLELPDVSSGVQYIETQPGEPGPNPNINTCVSFRAKIPEDPLYAPTLTCTVNDYLFAGLSQPLIGSFAIDLGKYVFTSKEKHQRTISALKDKSLKILMKDKPKKQQKLLDLSESPPETDPFAPVKIEEEKKEYKHLEEIRRERSEINYTLKEAIEGNVVLWPQFTQKGAKTVEINEPNPEEYITLGYNREPDDGMKQYRFYIREELEKTSILEKVPFDVFRIVKGQSRGAIDLPLVDDTHEDKHGQTSSITTVGKFKAMIRINEYPAEWNSFEKLKTCVDDEEADFEKISRELLVKNRFVIRIYLIDAFDLQQKDSFSDSDPYVRIKLGNKVITDRENHQTDCSNPKFMKAFDFNTVLPGKSILHVQLWDFNSVFSDSKIGTTRIDIEDRHFTPKWRNLKEKPVETRPIYVKSSRMPQGYLRMWLEVIPERDVCEPINISPRPPKSFEARLIIWKCEDVENMDFEGVSDLYIRAWVNQSEYRETDTHYRCQSGKGSWNWRLKFPLTLPEDYNSVTIQVWDRDIFSRNDFIAEATLPFNELAKTAWMENSRQKIYGEDKSEKFWVKCKKRNRRGELEDGGRVMVSFELVPEERYKACPVGEGRSEPNVDPKLPPPVGRFEWSWNPLKIISQLCGPEFKVKICLAVCCVLCLLMIIFIAPMLFSDMLSNLIL